MKNVILVRGAGDLASGVIYLLHRCGYHVLALETTFPTSIRRYVSFSEAIYKGETAVEGVTCKRIQDAAECESVWSAGSIPILADPEALVLTKIRPAALIDAMIAKRNLGTTRSMSPLTIALGPGFTAGEDVDYVIETMRGHDLGRIIRSGSALPNTGIPGSIAGVTKERVIHSPASGIMRSVTRIADLVQAGQLLAYVGETPVYATITGVLRGILPDGFDVPTGMKLADIDPRATEQKNCFTISDKARCIAGGVLEVLMSEGVTP